MTCARSPTCGDSFINPVVEGSKVIQRHLLVVTLPSQNAQDEIEIKLSEGRNERERNGTERVETVMVRAERRRLVNFHISSCVDSWRCGGRFGVVARQREN
jgi:hypothetical protein